MSTSKKSTPQERIDIRIPKNSEIYQYLYVDTRSDVRAKWQKLESLLAVADVGREDHATMIFEDFIARMSALYPKKEARLKRLRPLVLWHILWGEELEDEYWDKLRRS